MSKNNTNDCGCGDNGSRRCKPKTYHLNPEEHEDLQVVIDSIPTENKYFCPIILKLSKGCYKGFSNTHNIANLTIVGDDRDVVGAGFAEGGRYSTPPLNIDMQLTPTVGRGDWYHVDLESSMPGSGLNKLVVTTENKLQPGPPASNPNFDDIHCGDMLTTVDTNGELMDLYVKKAGDNYIVLKYKLPDNGLIVAKNSENDATLAPYADSLAVVGEVYKFNPSDPVHTGEYIPVPGIRKEGQGFVIHPRVKIEWPSGPRVIGRILAIRTLKFKGIHFAVKDHVGGNRNMLLLGSPKSRVCVDNCLFGHDLHLRHTAGSSYNEQPNTYLHREEFMPDNRPEFIFDSVYGKGRMIFNGCTTGHSLNAILSGANIEAFSAARGSTCLSRVFNHKSSLLTQTQEKLIIKGIPGPALRITDGASLRWTGGLMVGNDAPVPNDQWQYISMVGGNDTKKLLQTYGIHATDRGQFVTVEIGRTSPIEIRQTRVAINMERGTHVSTRGAVVFRSDQTGLPVEVSPGKAKTTVYNNLCDGMFDQLAHYYGASKGIGGYQDMRKFPGMEQMMSTMVPGYTHNTVWPSDPIDPDHTLHSWKAERKVRRYDLSCLPYVGTYSTNDDLMGNKYQMPESAEFFFACNLVDLEGAIGSEKFADKEDRFNDGTEVGINYGATNCLFVFGVCGPSPIQPK